MDDSPAGSIMLFALLIAASAYFSGAESAFVSVNKIHMMSRASQGSIKAQRVLHILEHFDEALSVILIGNNIVNIGCATISAVIATQIWGVSAVSVSTVVTTVIIFMFGEIIPKRFARSCNEHFAEAVSGSLLFLMKLLKPLSSLFSSFSSFVARPFKKQADAEPTLTEAELYDIVENISEEDGFDEDVGRLVKSAIRFSMSTAEQIMVPWDDVVKIKTSMKTPEILDLIKQATHSRIPVIDRKGAVKGILQIRKFLKTYIKHTQNVILASVIDYPYYVKPDIIIDDLLTDMSNHRRNLAIVRSANSEILGIITIEDILEELVGEIYDENDIGGDDYE